MPMTPGYTTEARLMWWCDVRTCPCGYRCLDPMYIGTAFQLLKAGRVTASFVKEFVATNLPQRVQVGMPCA